MSKSGSTARKGETQKGMGKANDVRTSNIIAAKAVADAVRTSLGPKGMDKMIQNQEGQVLISNDGATILKQLQVFHPTARMLVEISKSQDVEAGDGTTSVVVLAGALLQACSGLLDKGIHPTRIAECFRKAEIKAKEILRNMSVPVDLDDFASLVQAATTSLSSKVIYQNADLIAPMAVRAVLRVADLENSTVDLNDVKVVEQIGGTIEESEIINGICFRKSSAGPKIIKNAKIGICQFCLSAPKTDMENSIELNNYEQMDRIIRAERKYILKMCKKIKKSGCTVLLIQKSILRDAVNDLSLHFLDKMKIMTITNIERDDIEFIAKTIGCRPCAHVDSFTAEKLGSAELVEEVGEEGQRKVVKVTGIKDMGKTLTVLLRGSNKLLLEESGRSLHDALCVVRSLVKERYLITGGGAPEMELALHLDRWANELTGVEARVVKAYAEAMEVIPSTLAENAGMHPLQIVTKLRKEHALGNQNAGINVRKGTIEDISKFVLQPLLVNTSAIGLATECVSMILKIDDMVHVR